MMAWWRSRRRRTRGLSDTLRAFPPRRSAPIARKRSSADLIMFSGIVTAVGEILEVDEKSEGLRRLRIACDYDPDSIAVGASIACSGICLTVVEQGSANNRPFFAVDAAA